MLLTVKIAAAMAVADREKESGNDKSYHAALLKLHALLLDLRCAKFGFSEKHRTAVQSIEKIICARKFISCVHKASQFGRRRAAVVKELLSSEQTYTLGLAELTSKFGCIALAWGDDDAERLAVFAHVEPLVAFHRDELLPALQLAVDKKSATLLGAAFQLLATKAVAHYTSFVNGYDDAAAALHSAVAARPALGTWLDAQAGNVSVGCGLSRAAALLVSPVQRIPRYCMLMRDLIAFATATGDAAEAMHQSLAVLQQLAAHINDEKAKHQNQKLVRSICELANPALKQLLTAKSGERLAHSFVEKRISKPTLCHRCAKTIFGLARKAHECSACGFTCHASCLASVPPSCAPGDGDGDDFDFIDLVRRSAAAPAPLESSASSGSLSNVRTAVLAAPCQYGGTLSKKPLELAAAIVFDDEIVLASGAGNFSCAGVITLVDGLVAQVTARTVTLAVSADETHSFTFVSAELAKGLAAAINLRDAHKKKRRVRKKRSDRL